MPVEDRFLQEWGIDNDDAVAGHIRTWINGISPRLSPAHKERLFETAASIAEAEQAKYKCDPAETAHEHLRLCKLSLTSAELIQQIAAVYPGPWTGERAPIGELVNSLASFIEGNLQATTQDLKREAFSASMMIRITRKKIGKAYWALLRELAWLAGGRKALPAISTIRRYAERPRISIKTPWGRFWSKHFKTIKEALLVASDRKPQPFENAAADLLQLHVSSITSKGRLPQKPT